MGQFSKFLFAVLSGTQDKSIDFGALQNLLLRLGFTVRIKGDHFIYTKEGLEEIINIQPVGRYAKPYQVKQIRALILTYHLGGEIRDEV